jgi:cytochrome P450
LPAPVEYDPFSYEIHEDPYPTYERLREEAPLYWNGERRFWALSRHADVLAGFKDTVRLSNAQGISLEVGDLSEEARTVLSFLGMDPPEHDRMRSLVSKAFTPRRVAALEPRIRELARRHLDRVAPAGRCDFVADYAGRLPMDVVSELLGVPEADRDELRRWADLVLHREEGVATVPPEGVEASGRLLAYFVGLVAERRRRPGADLASALLAAELDGERLSDRDVIAFLYLMIIAGNETTTKLLANALYWIERNPAERKRVRGDPAWIPRWVEETLRFDNSTQVIGRTVARDHERSGRKLAEGDRVLLLLGSANRDERVFEDGDAYRLLRDTTPMLSFGQGMHFCLGASLARLEGRVALEEVWRRMPDYEIDPAGLVRVHSPNVRGFAALPLEFPPA